MRARPLALVCVAALAGCVAPAGGEPEGAAASVDPPRDVRATSWSGHIASSLLEPLAHTRPTDAIVWPVDQEGVLVEVGEGVREIEVALAWSGTGELRIMLHSHREGTGPSDVVMHVSPMDGENPKCIRVGAEDVRAGRWEMMARSDGATQTDFTLTMRTTGASARVLDERHGHDRVADVLNQRQDHEGSVEPCRLWSAQQGL